jgi:hypothetical protein
MDGGGVIACETSPFAFRYIPLQPPLAYIKELKQFFASEGEWSGYMTSVEYSEIHWRKTHNVS